MFCPQCGKDILEGQAFCQHCGAALTESSSGLAQAAGGRSKTDWEDREHSCFLSGLFATLRKILFRPAEFFRTMSVTGGLTDPLLFALIIGMVGLIFDYFWRALLGDVMHDFMPQGMAASSGQASFHGIGGMGFLAFFLPLLIIIGLFITSGFLHLFLMMIKGARAGYEATFRVAAYSYGANVLLALPVCGYLLAGVWAVVLTIIGLKEAHAISGGKAFFAVCFPVLLCCGLVLLAASVLFMGVFAASFGALMHLDK